MKALPPNGLYKGSLIIPVFNEEPSIAEFVEQVNVRLLENTRIEFELVFVNDGSTDQTLEVLLAIDHSRYRIKVVDLSRNFGKEAALTAGLKNATGDFCVPIDVDLQDPPEIVLQMIEKWLEGYEVVEAQRISRPSDSFSKRYLAFLYYKVHNLLSPERIPENVGDFRLLDAKVVAAVLSLPESQRFMKGIFSWVGFRRSTILYSRNKRIKGKTKFSFLRLFSLGVQGLTSFSTAPLRISTYLGFAVSISATIYGFAVIARTIVLGIEAPGYASIIVAITLLGGLQLLSIGVLGEYLGKTYLESKQRPLYIVRAIHQKTSAADSEDKNV